MTEAEKIDNLESEVAHLWRISRRLYAVLWESRGRLTSHGRGELEALRGEIPPAPGDRRG